jgi:hypothetical protein
MDESALMISSVTGNFPASWASLSISSRARSSLADSLAPASGAAAADDAFAYSSGICAAIWLRMRSIVAMAPMHIFVTATRGTAGAWVLTARRCALEMAAAATLGRRIWPPRSAAAFGRCALAAIRVHARALGKGVDRVCHDEAKEAEDGKRAKECDAHGEPPR